MASNSSPNDVTPSSRLVEQNVDATPKPRMQVAKGLDRGLIQTVALRNELRMPMLMQHFGVTLLYVVTAQLGLTFAVVGDTVTLVWPPSGVALAAILTFGFRMAPAIALGAFLANAFTDIPLAVAAMIAIGNSLEAITGALLLRRIFDINPSLENRRDVVALIVFAAFLATQVGAFGGVAALTVSGLTPVGEYWSVWLKWWLGDMMGVLIFAPALLIWRNHSRPPRPAGRAAWYCEVLTLAGALLATSYMIFLTGEHTGLANFSMALAVFPFVIWGALRFELPGASFVTLTISVIAILGTTRGMGPFAGGDPVEDLTQWCIFVNVVAITGLLLAASGAEYRRSQDKLRRSHEMLESKVEERTRQLALINEGLKMEVAKRLRLESELIRADESQQRKVGRDLHDGLGQQLTSIAFFSATLRERLEAEGNPQAPHAGRIVDLINQANVMVRAISRGLYPTALESNGLHAALEQLAETSCLLQNVHCEFKANAQFAIEDRFAGINLYRIAQEAVNNAIRHGHANHIVIRLCSTDDTYELSIEDDGIGFDQALPDHADGMGMRNLHYRADLLNGTLKVRSTQQQGTTITVSIPK